MNKTQHYMAKLGELCNALNAARDAEMRAEKAMYEAEKKRADAMFARHNAEAAYNAHLHSRKEIEK